MTSPIDEDFFNRIEQSLGVHLPEAYKNLLTTYPFGAEHEEWIFKDAGTIVEMTEYARKDQFFGASRPHEYLVIGQDGGGDLTFLDTSQPNSPVYHAQHDTTARADRLVFDEEAHTIDGWRRWYMGAIEDDRVTSERKAEKRWWQFWR